MMVAQDLLQEQLTKALPVVSICNQQPLVFSSCNYSRIPFVHAWLLLEYGVHRYVAILLSCCTQGCFPCLWCRKGGVNAAG